MSIHSLFTPRLELRAIPLPCYDLAFDDAGGLQRILIDLTIPDNWPAENWDEEFLDYSRDTLAKNPHSETWLGRFMIETATRTLIGHCGIGANREGIELGYTVLPQFRRRGFASEAVARMVRYGFEEGGAETIIAHTYPHLTPSIGTLEKNGFVLIGDGSAEGTIRFELRRE